jgi:hypothetical protein
MSANHPLPAALLALFVLAGCQESNTLLDFDGDGSLDQDDCNTADPQIYPGAPDGYGDDVDSNCDGSDGVDADGDGYPANAPADAPERDCNDSEASWHPGATDAVDPTGADSNCDGADGVDADGDGWASEASGGPALTSHSITHRYLSRVNITSVIGPIRSTGRIDATMVSGTAYRSDKRR